MRNRIVTLVALSAICNLPLAAAAWTPKTRTTGPNSHGKTSNTITINEVPFFCDAKNSRSVTAEFVNAKQKLALKIASSNDSADSSYAGAVFQGIAGLQPALILNIKGDEYFYTNAGLYINFNAPGDNPNPVIEFIPFEDLQVLDVSEDGTYQVEFLFASALLPWTFNSLSIVGFGDKPYTGYVYDVFFDTVNYPSLAGVKIDKVTRAISSCNQLLPLSPPGQSLP